MVNNAHKRGKLKRLDRMGFLINLNQIVILILIEKLIRLQGD